MYRFDVIFNKITMAFFSFAEMEKPILKFIGNCKGPTIAKVIFKKENKIGELTLSRFKTYYKATAIKTVWCWHKDREAYTNVIELRVQQ